MQSLFDRLLSLRSVMMLVLVCMGLSACQPPDPHRLIEVKEIMPNLRFAMTDVATGTKVSEADFASRIVILFFGYTFCPDVCPTTMATLSAVMTRLGPLGDDVSILFVTVDPARDTADYLKDYVASFSSRTTGLRGTSNELASLARRYRVAYTINPGPNPEFYTMNHTATLFIFDRRGQLQLLAPYGSSSDDIEHDLRGLIAADKN